MTTYVRTTVAAIAATALLAACSESGPATHTGTPTAAATSPAATATAPPSPAASPSGPARRLTKKQAAAAYVRIVDPGNQISDAINRDYTDNAPFGQYRADALAYVRADRAANRQLRSIRWPARVQPYITAMLLTYDPALIRCLQAGAAAGSRTAAANIENANQDCIAASDSTIPDTIRSMLGLPAR